MAVGGVESASFHSAESYFTSACLDENITMNHLSLLPFYFSQQIVTISYNRAYPGFMPAAFRPNPTLRLDFRYALSVEVRIDV
jgi:hypothetical protein